MPTNDDFYRTLLDNLYDGVYCVDRERTITYWNKAAEQITGYAASEVMGRRCSDNILRHVDPEGNPLCRGLCPLAYTIADGVSRNAEVYLHHKHGFRVPVSVRAAPIRNKQGAIEGAVEIFSDSTPQFAILERVAQFEKLAYLDPLTELANRRYTGIVLSSRYEEMQRYGWPFGVIFIDIDHFKRINDQYGHDGGDRVLKMIAKTLANCVRSFDIVGRWGGEEFLAVIANVERAEFIAMADRLHTLVGQTSIPLQSSLSVTVSIGAALARLEDTVEGLVKRADDLMYRSKAAGRNRVTVDE